MKKTTSTTKKRKKRTERSPRQQWVSERKWEAVGSINGIITRLKQIRHSAHILADEELDITEAELILERIVKVLRSSRKGREEESYKLFCKRKGFIP